MDEKSAITQLKQGDIGGLETLVNLYYLGAVRTAYLVTRDRGLAEDVVQSSFLRVYQNFDQFEPSRPFAPWFRRIVINNAIRAVNRPGKSLEVSLDYNAWLETELPDGIETAQEADWLAEIETRQEIWEALQQLTALQRAAIVLFYYNDLSVAEVALEMGCATGTVKAHLYAARRRLRDLLITPLDLKGNV